MGLPEVPLLVIDAQVGFGVNRGGSSGDALWSPEPIKLSGSHQAVGVKYF